MLLSHGHSVRICPLFSLCSLCARSGLFLFVFCLMYSMDLRHGAGVRNLSSGICVNDLWNVRAGRMKATFWARVEDKVNRWSSIMNGWTEMVALNVCVCFLLWLHSWLAASWVRYELRDIRIKFVFSFSFCRSLSTRSTSKVTSRAQPQQLLVFVG